MPYAITCAITCAIVGAIRDAIRDAILDAIPGLLGAVLATAVIGASLGGCGHAFEPGCAGLGDGGARGAPFDVRFTRSTGHGHLSGPPTVIRDPAPARCTASR